MAGQIFSGNINAICTSLMMVAMLVFAVAWEAFTGYLDRRVRAKCGLFYTRLLTRALLFFCVTHRRQLR